MKRPKKALFSVYGKTLAFDDLVRQFHRRGFEIIASGGTYKHIESSLGLCVTDTARITGLDPVLDHRVATLCPSLHGGLLADEVLHMKELDRLGWPFIDAVVCTFYPLLKAMEEKHDDPVAINNMVDIGGPCLIRSACKGGRLVVVDEHDYEWVAKKLNSHRGSMSPDGKSARWLRAKAVSTITAYVAAEAVFRNNLTRPD
jgi:AICAR transformylase/IMP cyclohydrolase PurH